MADQTRLATADVVPTADALSVATTNLASLTLDLSARRLPAGGMTLAIRSDLPLQLTLANLPAGARLACDGDWATIAEQSADTMTMSVQPSEETRSLTLAW
jgi:hypothetical protein